MYSCLLSTGWYFWVQVQLFQSRQLVSVCFEFSCESNWNVCHSNRMFIFSWSVNMTHRCSFATLEMQYVSVGDKVISSLKHQSNWWSFIWRAFILAFASGLKRVCHSRYVWHEPLWCTGLKWSYALFVTSALSWSGSMVGPVRVYWYAQGL